MILLFLITAQTKEGSKRNVNGSIVFVFVALLCENVGRRTGVLLRVLVMNLLVGWLVLLYRINHRHYHRLRISHERAARC